MKRLSIAIIYNATHHVLLFKSELIKAIKKNGYKVVVLASKDNYTKKLLDIVDENIKIPPAEFETELSLPSGDFQKII